MKKGTASRHGTRSCYVNRKSPCRCQDCKAANAAYQAAYMKLTYIPAPRTPHHWGVIRHGHARRDGTIRWGT